MDGYPIDHIPDRPTKRQEKDLLRDIGDFADFCKRLDKTHYWDDELKDFMPRTPSPLIEGEQNDNMS